MTMSSLEERRAERRRRRQMEEESSNSETKSADEIHAAVQERLARRRQERDERIANMAASVATVNGEDDLERRRRERREQRLRASGDTDYSASTDDYSSRRTRRRGTDDYTSEDTSSYSSYRSRRHRNWDDEETPTVNSDPVSSVTDTAEEDRRQRQQEEEEEEARRRADREAEDERERQAALEEERKREEERREEERREERRREEEEREREARRQAEEERQRLEEEERIKNDDEADFESESDGSIEDDNYKKNKLFIEEDDIVPGNVSGDKSKDNTELNDDSNKVVDVRRKNSDNVRNMQENTEKTKSVKRSTSLKEINNNKIRDKLNKFEHLKDASDNKSVNTYDRLVAIPTVDKDGLKEKLEKFEKDIKNQVTTVKDLPKQHSLKTEILSPQPHKLTDKVQHFETAAKSQSATKPLHLLQRSDSKDLPKKNVLDRWNSVEKLHPTTPTVTSPTDKKEVLNKRFSGNTEFIASKYLEKTSKSIDEPNIIKSPVSTIHKINLQSFDPKNSFSSKETQSDQIVDKSSNQSRSKVTARWSHNDNQSELPTDRKSSAQSSDISKLKVSARWPHNDKQTEVSVKTTSNHSNDQPNSKVTNRWPYDRDQSEVKVKAPVTQSGTKLGKRWPFEDKENTDVKQSENGRGVHSRESSTDNTYSLSRGSSIDDSADSSRRGYTQQEEEEEEERLRQQKEARMAAEEGQKRKTKRKGLGGLTPEKKKKLKDFIADIEYDDEELIEKENELMSRVQPLPDDFDYLSSAELRKLIKSLHEKLAQIHSESYDIEFKLNKQEKELVDLNMKISDSRGKFAKPVLRKVNKTEQKFAKLQKQVEHKGDFRDTIQSVNDDA